MHNELIKRLRECTAEMNGEKTLWHQAADAIEELQKDLERSKDFEAFWQHEAEEALKKFQVAISDKPRWIPVAERLPETHGHYFIWVARGKGKLIGYDDIGYFGRGKFSWEHISQEWPEEVTHWMPIPEPPKEET